MKISIKHIATAALLQVGLLSAQTIQPHLKTLSVGLRAIHLYDLPSYKYDTEFSKDMKGLNGDNTSFDLGLEVYVEKQFTPFWGVQLGFRNASLTGANNVEYYKNSFYEGTGDLIFNLSNLDKKHMESRLNYYARLGAGYGKFSAKRNLISDNSQNVEMANNYWEGRFGAGLQYELNSFLRVELDVAYNVAFNDGFDGYNNSSGSDPYLTTGIGLAYTFGKKENKPMYAVNFFSEEYFGVDEVQIAKENLKTKADSLMALNLELANQKLEAMNSVIAEQNAAIARLEKERAMEKAPKKEVKVEQRELVYFEFDSAVLSEDAKRELTKALSGNEVNISLIGYADNKGDSEYNTKLKAKRAEAVKKFLVEVLEFEPSAISLKLAEDARDLKNNDFLNRKVVISYFR